MNAYLADSMGTGLPLVERLTEISAYPTPADEATMLTFPAELNGMEFRLEDAQGKVVLRSRFESAGLHRLGTAELANGVYGIVVTGSSAAGRLLVKH